MVHAQGILVEREWCVLEVAGRGLVGRSRRGAGRSGALAVVAFDAKRECHYHMLQEHRATLERRQKDMMQLSMPPDPAGPWEHTEQVAILQLHIHP